MQMGFMPGKGMIDAIFIFRQNEMVEKRLCMAFVDLEKLLIKSQER